MSVTTLYRKLSSVVKVSSHGKRKETERLVVVALSGGVDSSVAAYLLTQNLQRGNFDIDIQAIHMSNWEANDDTDEAQNCVEQEWKDAQLVAQQLELPIHHVSFAAEYWHYVFDPFCQLLSSSKTPNPDLDCNRYIKFGVLQDYMQKKYKTQNVILATGHYARLYRHDDNKDNIHDQQQHCQQQHLQQQLSSMSAINSIAGGDADDDELKEQIILSIENDDQLAKWICDGSTSYPVLCAAKDRSKDQSYFLATVPPQRFQNVIFPLGNYYKKSTMSPNSAETATVRSIAQQAKLPSANKSESMGICFIGKNSNKKSFAFSEFMQQYIEPSATTRTEMSNQVGYLINIEDQSILETIDMSTHPLIYATVGQGAKIGGASQKWFVADKNLQDCKIFLCPGTHHPSLYANKFMVKDMNWTMPSIPMMNSKSHPSSSLSIAAKCRVRHLQPLIDCEIVWNENNKLWDVYIDTPIRGITPGQVAVFYTGHDGCICLGGGPIVQRGPTYFELNQPLPTKLHPSGHNDKSVK